MHNFAILLPGKSVDSHSVLANLFDALSEVSRARAGCVKHCKCQGCVHQFCACAATWTKVSHTGYRKVAVKVEGYKGLFYVAGSHEVEVSSGVHSRKRRVRSPSRLSRTAATSNTDEESSSLQTLAAAADSGELNPRPTVSLAVDLWCL
jgi:hypothetical protein